MSVTPVAAHPLPPELESLMRQLKTPFPRALAPELIATPRAQPWEPAEVIKALFVEEVSGRSMSMLANGRWAAGFPTGKTFDTWDESASWIPVPAQRAPRTFEWIGRKENVVVCGPSGTGKMFFLEAPASRSWRLGCGSRGSATRTSARWCARTTPTTLSAGSSPASSAQI